MSSFGESLKRERELREISLREIADSTKINIRYLEALEHNRFDKLPGGVFNKGFIRAYAAFIGADADALVDGYLLEIAAREPSPLTLPGVPGAAPGRATAPGMHRPVEAPPRRASGTGSEGAATEPGPNGARPVKPVAFVDPVSSATTLKALSEAVDRRLSAERALRGDNRRLLTAATSLLGLVVVLGALFFAARMFTRRSAPPEPSIASGEVSSIPEQASGEPEASGLLLAGPMLGPSTGTDAAISDATENEPLNPATPPTGAGSAVPGAVLPPARPQEPPRPVTTVPLEPPPTLEQRVPAPRPRTPAPVPGGPMDLRIEATSPVLVQISCDGDDRINRPLMPGEVASLRCFSLIRVSATDAGALGLAVNGAPCAPLGEPGARVQGFAIRSDDFQTICPPGAGASNARR